MSVTEQPGLSIGEMAGRSGVAEGTLRMWEARYGFPVPQRLPSGHRRYGGEDLERVLAVLRARGEGLPLSLAIRRALRLGSEPEPSIYAALRQRYEHLHPHSVPKRILVQISRAIEDECSSRARQPLLLACFQRERFYRQVESRWRELARTAELAIVLADFKRARTSGRRPAEVPLEDEDPLLREWLVVCESDELPVCLVAWERPPRREEPRRFEMVWTVEPEIVRDTARLCCELVARRHPELVSEMRERLADPAPPAQAGQLRATVELATRIALYAASSPQPARGAHARRRPRS